MERTRVVTLALIVAAFAVGGCGGSSKPLTRAELTSKADTICRRVNAKLAATNTRVKSQKDIARLAPQLASFEQAELAELAKLVPPSDLADDWKEIVAGAQTLADNTVKLGEYAKANNIAGARGLIASSQKVQQQMIATATRDGFAECSKAA